jgi:hypothetical protein
MAGFAPLSDAFRARTSMPVLFWTLVRNYRVLPSICVKGEQNHEMDTRWRKPGR